LDQYPLAAIYPIMVGSIHDGAMNDFFADTASVHLSNVPSAATDEELQRVLPEAEVTVGASVSETKRKLLECLGVKAWDPKSTHGKAVAVDEWRMHEGCATQIHQLLCRVTQEGTEQDGAGSKRPSRTKKGIRASAVSSSMAVLLEGPLMKRSTGTLKRWQKRYFVVGGHYLKYAANEQAARATPKATIDLHALQSCKLGPDTFVAMHFIDGMELELQAATKEEAAEWHEVLAQFEVPVGRKTSLLQSLEHYAPRKGTLVFERKGSFERKTQSTSLAPAAGTAAPEPAPTSELSMLLISLDLSEYHAALVAEGYDKVGDVQDMGMEELVEIGMKKGHAKRLLKHFGN
jgi:hypothetical protein